MSSALRALIFGSGFAGQGHTQALRDAGVEVVGMVGRTPKVLEEVSASLKIPYVGTDWEKALEELKPDIVAIATPGGAHYEPIMSALSHGCHVYCDKPLAATAVHAKALKQKAEAVGVKTAYAASYRYMPHVLLAKELVANGTIGEPLEAECVSHFNLNPLIPFGWSHTLEQGGGRLNNNFVHKLSIVEHVLDGKLTAVSGSIRSDLEKAPIVKGVHHFLKRHNYVPESPDDPNLEWAESDAEWSYTVQAKIDAKRATQPVSALFQHSGLHPRFHPDYIAFYGREAAIYIKGHYGHGPLYLHPHRGEWEEISIPSHIQSTQPVITDDTQRNWTILAQEFVDDICGKGNSGYQTFDDGAFYQEIIEVVRAGDGWVDFS